MYFFGKKEELLPEMLSVQHRAVSTFRATEGERDQERVGE